MKQGKNITNQIGEKLTCRCSRASNLIAMDNKKDGFAKTYLANIGYDKFEQRVYLQYGNSTETNYEYETNRRRLLKMMAENNTRSFMDTLSQYDVVNNVLKVNNKAILAPTGMIGGGTIPKYHVLYSICLKQIPFHKSPEFPP